MKIANARIFLPFISLLVPGICMAQPANTIHRKIKNNMVIMNSNQNKDIIKALYEQVLNNKDFKHLSGYISQNYVGVQGNTGPQAFEDPIAGLIKAFPNIHWTIEEPIAEGDKVMVSRKWTGTHAGQFQSFRATGKTITNNGMGIYTLKEGKITKATIQTDRLDFLQQLGVVPVDISQLSIPKDNTKQVIFIDKFIVPIKAEEEFMSRVNYNRSFIKKLPGFVKDNAYESTDNNGNILITTIAVWENEAALANAKEAVQAAYKQIGFDPAEMTKRLGITLDRAVYKALD
jgi:predicted ester cyclase/heme-degrading monooxygenase HmoA